MLKLLLKDDKGYREREFGQDVVTIGRSGDNDIVLDHQKVSRAHARIEKSADGYRISDLGSGNGTVVNGTKVLSCVLLRGDEIRIGETTIIVLAAGSPLPVPQAVTDRVDRATQSAPRAPAASAPPPARAGGTGRTTDISVQRVAREAASVLPGLFGRLILVLVVVVGAGVAVFAAIYIWRTRPRPKVVRGGGEEAVPAPFDMRTAESKEVEARVRAELEAGRYRNAQEILKRYAESTGGSDAYYVSLMTLLIHNTIDADFKAVKEEGGRLQEKGRYDEAKRHYAANAGRFEGTEHYLYLSRKPELLEELARVKGAAGSRRDGPPGGEAGGTQPGDWGMGAAAPFDILKSHIILRVQEEGGLDFAMRAGPGEAGLCRVVEAHDNGIRVDTGQGQQEFTWEQFGDARLHQLCRPLAARAPVPVQAAFLRLAVNLGQGHTAESMAVLESLREKSPTTARQIEEEMGISPAPTPPPKPPESPPASKPPQDTAPAHVQPPANPPAPGLPPADPPPPAMPPENPPDRAPEAAAPKAPVDVTPAPAGKVDKRKMPMNLVFASHEAVMAGDALKGNGAAGPVPGKGSLLAAVGREGTAVFACAFAAGAEGMARNLVLSAGSDGGARGIRTFTNPPILAVKEAGAGDGMYFQKPRVGGAVEGVDYRCRNTFFTVFSCSGSSCLSVMGVPPAHWDYNGTVRVGTKPMGVAMSHGDWDEKYAFAACQGDGTIAAVFLHEVGPLRRGDRMGETVYFDAATGKLIDSRPAAQQIIDTDGRGGGQAGFAKIPGAPGPASRAGQALGIEDVALLQRGPWTAQPVEGRSSSPDEGKEAYLFVTNTKANSVSVFNAAPFLTGRSKDLVLLGTIADMPNPKKLLVVEGKQLWVGSNPGSVVARIDIGHLPSMPSRPPQMVPVGRNPAHMAWLAGHGGILMVANSGADSVSMVKGNREVGRLDAANSAPMAEPYGIWISGFGDRMIVTNRAAVYATWWNFRLYPEGPVGGPQDLIIGSGNVLTGMGAAGLDGDLNP